MIVRMRWLVPAAFLSLGLYLLHQSYRSFAQWNEYLKLGDPSGAELYELNFWLAMPPSILMLMLSGFLAGRWSRGARRLGSRSPIGL